MDKQEYFAFCHDLLVKMVSSNNDFIEYLAPSFQNKMEIEYVEVLLNEVGLSGHWAKHLLIRYDVDLTQDVPVKDLTFLKE